METNKTGISRELLIHPGETIADLLEQRNMTQSELSHRTGMSKAYISKVISGKKDISPNLALALEYAFDIPKSFWINLQANYDAELLSVKERESITDEELKMLPSLKQVISLTKSDQLPREDQVLILRKALGISNLSTLDPGALAIDIYAVNRAKTLLSERKYYNK